MKKKKKINNTTVLFTNESKVLGGVNAVSTLDIAEAFGKNHKRVLEDFDLAIKRLKIGEHKIRLSSNNPYFAEISYTSKQNKQVRALAVSEQLCYMVILAYTGEAAFNVRKQFVKTFFDMRNELERQTQLFINKSKGQRDRRRKELKADHKKELAERNALIEQCMVMLKKNAK